MSTFKDLWHALRPRPTPLSTPPPQRSTNTIHQLYIGDQCIEYRIERCRRKTIGLIVDASGVRVRAAPSVPLTDIERLVCDKAQWIHKHLTQRQSTIQNHFAPDLPEWVRVHGDTQGNILNLLGCTTAIYWGHAPSPTRAAHELYVPLPVRAQMSDAQWHTLQMQALIQALGAHLLRYLNAQAQSMAQQHNLRYRHIVLSNARTTWGTCRRDGLIRINWRLVFLDACYADYVLAHELAHTVHMNHSAAFWQQVAHINPQYRQRRHEMKAFSLR